MSYISPKDLAHTDFPSSELCFTKQHTREGSSMDSIAAQSLSPSDSLTAVFNLSETIAWSTDMPDNPVDAFIGSVQNGSSILTSWF